MRRVLMAVLIVVTSCGSVASYPYRACVFSRAGGKEFQQAGSVLAKRDPDDALLFAYDDRSAGDSGFQWIRPNDTRTVRPCKQATLTDAMYPAPEVPKAEPWKR